MLRGSAVRFARGPDGTRGFAGRGCEVPTNKRAESCEQKTVRPRKGSEVEIVRGQFSDAKEKCSAGRAENGTVTVKPFKRGVEADLPSHEDTEGFDEATGEVFLPSHAARSDAMKDQPVDNSLKDVVPTSAPFIAAQPQNLGPNGFTEKDSSHAQDSSNSFASDQLKRLLKLPLRESVEPPPQGLVDDAIMGVGPLLKGTTGFSPFPPIPSHCCPPQAVPPPLRPPVPGLIHDTALPVNGNGLGQWFPLLMQQPMQQPPAPQGGLERWFGPVMGAVALPAMPSTGVVDASALER